MLTYHEKLDRMCKRRGYGADGISALWLAVTISTIYKFKRNYNLYNWQYEVEMPGYGVPANKEKWIDVQIIGGKR